MANHRDTILETIRNLRAKASNAASTEAEAQTAAMMAAKLLQKHDVKETELEIKKEGAEHGESSYKAKVLPEILHYCGVAIERLTETKCYAQNAQINYIGTPHDVQMALYLSEMLVGASKRAWFTAAEAFEGAKFKDLAQKRLSFYHGFGTSLSHRMIEMANERAMARKQAQGEAKGSALVVVKEALIKQKMAEMGLELVKGKHRNIGKIDNDAWSAGQYAGKKVNLNRPVESDGNEAQGQLS